MTGVVAVLTYPGDTREDQAHHIAAHYRSLLVAVLKGEIADGIAALYELDQTCLKHGAHWIIPDIEDPYELDDWITAADAAHYTGYKPTTIRKWAELKRKGGDGIIEQVGPDGRPRYNVGDIVRYGARQKQRRIQRQLATTG